MDRRRIALFLLLGFIGCIGATVAVLVLLDLLTAGGPDVGAGLVQWAGELVIMAATVRLALGVARPGRAR